MKWHVREIPTLTPLISFEQMFLPFYIRSYFTQIFKRTKRSA